MILLVSGSVREGSTNVAVLRTAEALSPEPAAFFDGLAALPHFNPDDDHDPLPEPVVALRSAIADADAILFCTPEYAGTMPGALKNLLEWTVGGVEMTDKPVGWVNASGRQAPTGGAGTYETLRTVLGYVNVRFVEEACVRVPVHRDEIADGLVVSEPARGEIGRAVAALAAAAAREVCGPPELS